MATAAGVLTKYQLFRVMTRLASQGFSGALVIEDAAGQTTVHLDKGTPLVARSSEVALSLPAFLLRRRRIDRGRLKVLLEESAARNQRLDDLLVERGIFSVKDLARLKRELSVFVFSSCFHKEGAAWRLVPGEPLPSLDDARSRTPLEPRDGLFRSILADKDLENMLRLFREHWDAPLRKSSDFYRHLIQFRSVFFGEDVTELLMEAGVTAQSILDSAADRDGAIRQLFALCLSGMVTFDTVAEPRQVAEDLSGAALAAESGKTLVFLSDSEGRIVGPDVEPYFRAPGAREEIESPAAPTLVFHQPEDPPRTELIGVPEDARMETVVIGAEEVSTWSETGGAQTAKPAPEALEADELDQLLMPLRQARGPTPKTGPVPSPAAEPVAKAPTGPVPSAPPEGVSEPDLDRMIQEAFKVADSAMASAAAAASQAAPAPAEKQSKALATPPPLPDRPATPEPGTDENIERILDNVYRGMLAKNLYEILGVTAVTPLSGLREAATRVKNKYRPNRYVGYMLSSRSQTILQYIAREIQRATDVLTDREERAVYDNQRGTDYGQDRRVALSLLFDAEATFQHGLSEQKRGNWPAALMQFTRACESNPRDPDYLAHKGLATFQALKEGAGADEVGPQRARAAIEKALALDPRHANAMLFLARIERELGNVQGALQWYERLHKMDPTHSEANAALDALKLSASLAGSTPSGKSLWTRVLEWLGFR